MWYICHSFSFLSSTLFNGITLHFTFFVPSAETPKEMFEWAQALRNAKRCLCRDKPTGKRAIEVDVSD